MRFEVKVTGLLHYFLGLKIVQNQAKGSVWIGQPTYTVTLLERFEMENAKSVKTPVSSGSQLVKTRVSDKYVNQTLYLWCLNPLDQLISLRLLICTCPVVVLSVACYICYAPIRI